MNNLGWVDDKSKKQDGTTDLVPDQKYEWAIDNHAEIRLRPLLPE